MQKNTVLPEIPSIAPIEASGELYEQLKSQIDSKTKPLGALGNLESHALRLGLIQSTSAPSLKNSAVVVFAGDHGIAQEGVSAYPPEVTAQMVLNFSRGGAGINVFCRQHNLSLTVVDAGVAFDFDPELNIEHRKVAPGTKSFLEQPAMDQHQFETAFGYGRKVIQDLHRKGCNAAGFGEMGIGNTTAAAAIMSRITGHTPQQCTGAGTGLDAQGLVHKTEIITRALSFHQSALDSVKDNGALHASATLRTFGGFEMVMMAGGMLEAAAQRMVIIVDGFISSSAFLAALEMEPALGDYAFFSHCSDEAGHKMMLDYIQAKPILDLGLRLGEGTGTALAYPILKSAQLFLAEMASFAEAGVSEKDD